MCTRRYFTVVHGSRTRGWEPRNIHEHKFYRPVDILTLLLAARGPCERGPIGACGRYFTTESRATPIVLRENDFLPCPWRACGRPIRLRNNEPRCLESAPGFERTEAVPKDYCRPSIVPPPRASFFLPLHAIPLIFN